MFYMKTCLFWYFLKMNNFSCIFPEIKYRRPPTTYPLQTIDFPYGSLHLCDTIQGSYPSPPPHLRHWHLETFVLLTKTHVLHENLCQITTIHVVEKRFLQLWKVSIFLTYLLKSNIAAPPPLAHSKPLVSLMEPYIFVTLSKAPVPTHPPTLDMGIWKPLFLLTKTHVFNENLCQLNTIHVVDKKISSASRNSSVF